MSHRQIVHMDLDTFFVSVERLREPKLVGKPVIVGGTGERGVVAACSYEARAFGIHSAMPIKRARILCPDAVFMRGDFEAYSSYSSMVTEIISEKSPVVEKASIDEFYIDMTGMDRFFGTYQYSLELKHLIKKETGLSISFGVSQNKTVSKVATGEVKPDGQITIPYGQGKSYLAPLDVAKIPGVGAKTGFHLKSLGVSKVRQLAEMPPKMLESAFGQWGINLWEKANAIDVAPVIPYHDQKSLGKEETFQTDTVDLKLLKAEIIRMTVELGYELRRMGFMTGCVTVKLRYSNFDTVTRQKNIMYSNADHILIDTATELFDKLFARRILIRLIGVRFTKLVQGFDQLNLFDDSARISPLYAAMDKIRTKYDIAAITRAINLNPRR